MKAGSVTALAMRRPLARLERTRLSIATLPRRFLHVLRPSRSARFSTALWILEHDSYQGVGLPGLHRVRQDVVVANSAGDREMKALLAAHRSVTIGNPDTACVSGDRS